MEPLALKAFRALYRPRSQAPCSQEISAPPGWFHSRMSSRPGAFKLVEMHGGRKALFTRCAEVDAAVIQAREA